MYVHVKGHSVVLLILLLIYVLLGIFFSLMNEVVHTSPTIGSNVEEVQFIVFIHFKTFLDLMCSTVIPFISLFLIILILSPPLLSFLLYILIIFFFTDRMEKYTLSYVGYRGSGVFTSFMEYILCSYTSKLNVGIYSIGWNTIVWHTDSNVLSICYWKSFNVKLCIMK